MKALNIAPIKDISQRYF